MKVYLKSGNKIRISQEVANELVDMIVKGEKDFLVRRFKIWSNVHMAIKIDEIEAIN